MRVIVLSVLHIDENLHLIVLRKICTLGRLYSDMIEIVRNMQIRQKQNAHGCVARTMRIRGL